MTGEGDIVAKRKPRLSKLAVMAFISSLQCIVVMGILVDVLPLRHTMTVPYLWLIRLVPGVIWGGRVSRSSGLTESLIVPGLVLLTVPLPIVLGFVGTVHIDRSYGRLKGVSLGMAAITIAMICLLAAGPLIPGDIQRAREAVKLIRIETSDEKRRECIVALGAELKRYADYHGGIFPEMQKWCNILKQGHYLDDQQTLLWLANKGRWPCAINPDCCEDSPGETVLLFETRPGWNMRGGPELLKFTLPHDGHVYVLLKNQQLKTVTRESVETLVWK